jgi:early secretory antigenic target protein ESAT-6
MQYDNLVVNFAQLQATSHHIQTAIGNLEAQLAQLERDAAPLVDTWNGDAKQAYLQRQATWRQASTELAGMLREIKRALDESVLDYQSTERANVNLFR